MLIRFCIVTISGGMICVNDFLKIILISSLLIQIGCSNRIYEQPSDKYPFETKMKALLGDNGFVAQRFEIQSPPN